jgi:threonylcarbamoyladenosine tRNA methylthiotransferase MtaB
LRGQIGRRLRILTERGGMGRAEDFTPVRTPGLPPGLLVEGVACGAGAGALDVTFDLPSIEMVSVR